MYSSEGKSSGKLYQMLNDPRVTPLQLFAVPNITGDITQNIQDFFTFCRKRKQFTIQMFKFCLDSTYEDLQDQKLKKVVQQTIEVITNDEDVLANFLFADKNNGVIQEDIAISSTIESQAERLFSDPKIEEEVLWKKQSDAFQKFEIVMLTFSHLSKSLKNQTCLGYINKMYSSLIRREGNLFLEFLKQNPDYLNLILHNMHYCSIGNIIALTLSSEDKNAEYKYQTLKMQIFEKILNYGIDNIEKPERFQGFLTIVQEVLNSTKQSYYEYFQDFKRCANILVSEATLRKFYQLLNKSETSFGRASSYLQLIIKRINSQSEQPDYYRQNSSEPTMKFQHSFLYTEVGNLVDWIGKSYKYDSMARVTFLGLLNSLFKNMIAKSVTFVNLEIFKKLVVYYMEQRSHGLVKNYIFQLIKVFIKKMSENQIKEVSGWLSDKNLENDSLREVADDRIKGNSNPTLCFLLSILFEIQNKDTVLVAKLQKQNNINLSNTFDKYRSKLANYGQQEDDIISPIDQEIQQSSFKIAQNKFLPSFLQTQTETKNKEEIKEESSGQRQQIPPKETEIQLIGKNNIVIPVLNLPSKGETKITIEQQQVQQVKISQQFSRQALIRELKNTKIELPERLKPKKQEPEQPEQKREEVQVKKDELQKAEQTTTVIKQFKAASAQVSVERPILGSTVEKAMNISVHQQKFYVKHILLF